MQKPQKRYSDNPQPKKYYLFICKYDTHVPIKVHKAIEEERRKSEAQKVKAVQVHCGILEEQNRKSLESMRSETQREKNKATALQHKVVELQTVSSHDV